MEDTQQKDIRAFKATFGTWVHDRLTALSRFINFKKWFKPKPATRQVAFTIAFVGLAAKMAKADGVAVAVETEAFERCFYVPPNERANVKRVFDLAAKDVAGYEIYAKQIARMLKDEPALKRDVFECLFNIAAADGIVHKAEEDFLKTVAGHFEIGEEEYQTIRSLFVHDPKSPYVILGISPNATNAELKARYHELVKQNHPDQLVAAGVPHEFLVIADRKLAAINAAYEAILKSRAGEVSR